MDAIHLNSIIYNVLVRLEKYLNIDGKWFRSLCDNCLTPIQTVKANLCRSCFIGSIKGNLLRLPDRSGSKHTRQTKNLISQKKQKIVLTYSGLHQWLGREFPKEQVCENLDCLGKSQYFDWACITGKYEKDINNFRRLCRSCHKLFDKGKIKLRLEVAP